MDKIIRREGSNVYFSKKFLEKKRYGALGGLLLERIIDLGRWEAEYEMVFEHEGKYYMTTYTKGATEMQFDSQPWEDMDEVCCTEVEKKVVSVEKWVPVKVEGGEK